MTIAAAYRTSEGIVLGADSMASINDDSGVHQLLNHAQKVFEVGIGSQYGVCVFGSGALRTQSHRTVCARLADEIGDKKMPVSDVADKLMELVGRDLPDAAALPVGYMLGGTEPGTRAPSLWHLTYQPNGVPHKTEVAIGPCFDGAPDFMQRILWGYAAGLPEAVLENLKALMPTEAASLDQHYPSAFNSAAEGFRSFGHLDVPIRNAIDYVYTALRLTVKSFNYRYGAPLCGGPLEIAVITTDRPFRWVVHKEFDSAILENRHEL